MKAGQPTKYRAEFIEKADEYLAQCNDIETNWLKSYTTGKIEGETFEHRVKVNLPTHEGFADFLGVNASSLYEWAKKNKEFSKALEKIVSVQKQRLLANGLSGDYNPTIAKLILSANHGMKEKTDITTNDKDLPQPIYGGRAK